MNEELSKKFFSRLKFFVIVFLAIIFFFFSSSFNYFSQKQNFVKWGSPDETANYIFTKLYADDDKLSLYEKYNLEVDDIIHPRSFRSDEGRLKPVSFLGMILLYGSLAKFFDSQIIPYLTPFFAGLGIIFYYLFLKKLFGARIAFYSGLLLSFFPVYFYYSARSMFHNVLFVVFFIISLYFSLLMADKEKISLGRNLSAIFSGIFFGLAIAVRSSELLWLGPLFLILLVWNFKRIKLIQIILFLNSLLLALLPTFYYNQLLYGAFWQGGYPEMNQAINNIVSSGTNIFKSLISSSDQAVSGLNTIKDNIFHFGFHAYDSLRNFIDYFVVMFYWIFVPSFLGLILFLQDWHNLKPCQKIFIINYFLISLILVFYYGSWQFNDNPDASQATIGNSYTRYWLPIYLGAIPFSIILLESFFSGLFKVKKKHVEFGDDVYAPIQNQFTASLASLGPLKKPHLERFFVYLKERVKLEFSFLLGRDFTFGAKFFVQVAVFLSIILMLFISVRFVLVGSDEGLIKTLAKNENSREEYNLVLSLTESNAVIITRYHDKLFFPDRKVIVGLFDDKEMIARYAKLAKQIPVYYYNFTLPKDSLDYLNQRRLKEFNLQIREIKTINDFSLYHLTPNFNAL